MGSTYLVSVARDSKSSGKDVCGASRLIVWGSRGEREFDEQTYSRMPIAFVEKDSER